MRVWVVPLILALLVAPPAFGQSDDDQEKSLKIDPPQPGQEAGPEHVKKLLDEIQENMNTIEKLLLERNTGESTQSRQTQVVEQIEKLIEEMNKT